ncbi:phytanoyl-CoA dioxygenase family protein [Paraburkholderia sp.]|uniref:phytanoyl-CoA dioxygenase family protein n=1 Tax=Paraburkholderia sp. TaxID=1926495 RepID=UPI00239857FA|nr:phytanoyl-CoA dioxygenase family protein [Paraburkholderia sp.]MDE1181811.1 phytanoyl-CoA dioxygenase family protein [Paraburkholderia sp.]
MTQTIEQRVAAAVTDELVQSFRKNGAVRIRNIFTADELAILRDAIDHNIAQPSPRAKVASRPDDPGWFFEDFCNWQDNAGYRRFITGSPAASVAGALVGGEAMRFYHDHVLVKEPNTRQRTPWHQDQPYYNIVGEQNVSMWIPVDPVSRESTLEFVAGSHLGPWLMPRTFMENEAKWFPEGSLADLPDIEANRDAYPILGWELEPGDMVCFHMLTLHASGGVSGNHRRRAFSLRFIGDDTRHKPRPWRTSPEFPGLRESLPEDSPMTHPLFPVLWRADSGQVEE